MLRSNILFTSALLVASIAAAQESNAIPARRALITEAVDNQKRVTLLGNTRSAVSTATDEGAVPENLPLDHMLLQLQRPAELEEALNHFIDQLHDSASPNYHQWLTAAEFGEKFGVADSDINAISQWLTSQGFVVNQVYANKLTIDFSGTAGQVRSAFRSDIHYLDAAGTRHMANMSNPQIPAALASVVKGVVSLHDFMPHSFKRDRNTQYYISSGTQAVVPADLATIYNLNPLFSRGITGQGQTIVVIEDTDVYSTNDWSTFRSTFGLSSYSSGSFVQVHPGNCGDPGVVAGNDEEATLDAEYASAAAPGAAIQLASCPDTSVTFGGLIALQNLLNASGTPPALVSISYGDCEADNGAAANAAYASTYQQAVTEGVSVFVSSGDAGAAMCDDNSSYATHGIGVNAFASTPYNVAVGGTDFGDTYLGTSSTYWNTTNTSTYASAKSYVPEIPWDDSCASNLIAGYLGYSTVYGASGFCNSATGKANFINTTAASGGPSQCATGAPSTTDVVSGTCQGYAKPSWQSGLYGNPSDSVRDLPDVSLFAANGVWGHYYVFCFSDTANGGAACSGAPSNWSGAGGTSFAAPIMAGFQSLVNQSTGSRWGNPNTKYYALAASEYGTSGTTSCLSSSSPASSCTFYDITLGNMDVVCHSSVDCFDSSGSGRSIIYGALSTSSTSFNAAYATAPGWDFATGIGSVNVNNLVSNWSGSSTTQPTSSATYTGLDTTTQGAWSTKYGADGFQIANDSSSSLPSYATISFSGASTHTWAYPTSDVRALEYTAASPTRIASTYYSGSASFSINLNLTDGNTHQVALYLLDFSNNGRSETISVADAATSTVLSTQAFTDFNNGQYAVWTIKGNVVITVTVTSNGNLDNPLVAGLFFGAGITVTSTATATYSGLDTTTQGTWTGKYGSDGFEIANDTSSALPSYAQLTFNGASTHTWAYPTSDPRAPQYSSASSTRIAATYYTGTSSTFSANLNLTDGNSHIVSLYLLDWSNNGRSEAIVITDAGSGAVLSTQSFTNFDNGQYAVWNIKGNVLITVTVTSNGVLDNPLVAGFFFGPPIATSATATYVGPDTTTQGTWTGKYGADGYVIANDATSLPSYASFSAPTAITYTWAEPTTDPRALQVSSGSTTRIASTYYTYSSQSFTVNLSLNDGNTHKVSLYLLDFSDNSRVQTITINDAASNQVLDTETFTNFNNGEYAAWNIKGNVTITITCTSTAALDNPLLSAVFFN